MQIAGEQITIAMKSSVEAFKSKGTDRVWSETEPGLSP